MGNNGFLDKITGYSSEYSAAGRKTAWANMDSYFDSENDPVWNMMQVELYFKRQNNAKKAGGEVLARTVATESTPTFEVTSGDEMNSRIELPERASFDNPNPRFA